MEQTTLTQEAIALLKKLIATPSFSSQEQQTAILIEKWFTSFGIPCERLGNNCYAFNKYFDNAKPTLLLNSHHDTVKPNKAYTLDPFLPIVKEGKLFGLGSNDAGGCLVSLLAVFTHFYAQKNLSYNLILVASAEEESSGPNGLNSVLPLLPEIDVAIVGEPTKMDLAVAEKGLIVFDAVVNGTPGHAAHPNKDNSIYNTIEVLKWFQEYEFEKVSELLGEVKMTVTQIHAGSQHNVVPAETHLVIDVRVNDRYTNNEINYLLKEKAPCRVTPRSLRLNSSSIPMHHALVKAGIAMGRTPYGSPTLSDQAALSCPSLKMGPGDSTRSHTADEFIYLHEIEEGIDLYIKILNNVILNSNTSEK
ncbi:M20 family metallo-hydrolase [Ascidiimonas aurantiaca]|uniref:M20 family metallo-hydrolase n=1 Tax=Ascidiimonas aurantiaca TaxID=1685432 RepID=UPI0030EDC6CC